MVSLAESSASKNDQKVDQNMPISFLGLCIKKQVNLTLQEDREMVGVLQVFLTFFTVMSDSFI